MKTDSHYMVVGLDFVDAYGKRLTSIQSVNQHTKKAEFSIDFTDGKPTRIGIINALKSQEKKLIKKAKLLMAYSIPQTFGKA